MSKKTKEQVQEANNEMEVKKTWLNAYIAPKNTTARVVTENLLRGATIQQMIDVCKGYNSKLPTKQAWGEKASDLTSHMRWMVSKGFSVQEKDGNFKLSA